MKEYIKDFDKLSQSKYPGTNSLLSRCVGSEGDRAPAQRALMNLLEIIGLEERKKTILPQLSRWIHGSCFGHNASSNKSYIRFINFF